MWNISGDRNPVINNTEFYNLMKTWSSSWNNSIWGQALHHQGSCSRLIWGSLSWPDKLTSGKFSIWEPRGGPENEDFRMFIKRFWKLDNNAAVLGLSGPWLSWWVLLLRVCHRLSGSHTDSVRLGHSHWQPRFSGSANCLLAHFFLIPKGSAKPVPSLKMCLQIALVSGLQCSTFHLPGLLSSGARADLERCMKGARAKKVLPSHNT